jgi:exodeoxyribonuclease VII large subunit
MALLEERKRKFAAEGLFAEERKKPLPYLPRIVGVVTSPTGAVIRDILHRLEDRFPTRVIVWPVRVQGETSAAEVAAAIAGFNALTADSPLPRPDLLIVARGGGSLEDLWSFNEEAVVRAAAASVIPLISAVGHETDFTLIDFVADRRAPTPTAAAEMAVPVRSELIAAIADLSARQYGATSRQIQSARRELRAAARALPRPEDILAIPRRRLDELAARIGKALIANTSLHHRAFDRAAARLAPANLARLIERGRDRVEAFAERSGKAMQRRIERRRASLEGSGKLLEALSYRSVLARGFALVSSGDGLVRSATAVTPGMALRITFGDGAADVVATGSEAKPKAAARPAKTPGGSQGSLF